MIEHYNKVDIWIKDRLSKIVNTEKEYSFGDLNKYLKEPGMYGIYITTSGYIYFGSTNHLYRRRIKHIADLRNNIHSNPDLQKEFNKSGLNKFIFLYQKTNSIEEAINLEQEFVNSYWGNPKLLNIGKNVNKPMLGRKHTDSAKLKLSKIVYTKERLAKMSVVTKQRFINDPELANKLSLISKEQWSNYNTKQIMIDRALPNLKLGILATSKSVTIEGIIYSSIAEAARVYKVCGTSIRHKIKSKNYPRWTMTNNLSKLIEPSNTLPKSVNAKGIVAYSDGGCRGGSQGM